MIDAYGKVVASCPDDKVTSATFELQIDALNAFRKKFPVLEDADAFSLFCKR
jgi:predicted amidohydrolase